MRLDMSTRPFCGNQLREHGIVHWQKDRQIDADVGPAFISLEGEELLQRLEALINLSLAQTRFATHCGKTRDNSARVGRGRSGYLP